MSYNDLRAKILSVADSTIKWSKDLRIPSAEAYVFYQNLTQLNWNKGKVDSRDGIIQGVGIRVADGQKIGFSSCTGFTEKSIKATLENAFSIAKASPKNPRFTGFIGNSQPSKEGKLDEEFLSVDSELLATQAQLLANEGKIDDDRLIGLAIELKSVYLGIAIGTTEGCMVSSLNNYHVASADSVVSSGNDRKSGFKMEHGRNILDVSGIGTKAIEQGLNALGSKKLDESFTGKAILNYETASELYGAAFQTGLNGGSYVNKRNPFAPKLGKQIAIEKFNVIDDGQNPEYLGTMAVDDEGSPTQSTKVVENGVLTTFLYNKMYGDATELGTTGNCSRGLFGNSIPFESSTRTDVHQLVVTPGNKDLESLISGIDGKAVLIEGHPIGIHTTNWFTGDFSVTSSNAYLIKNGEILHPLTNISFAGNLYKSLMDIKEIGSDLKITKNPILSPSLVVDDFTFSN
ncbi:MAG: TldD/PmbA family protein [Promethearchaeota archaeon]